MYRLLSAPMDREQLFLRSLDDLEQRIADQDPYTILGASAIVRKLLIDGNPLVDQVNREHRLKIRFEVGEQNYSIPGVPDPTIWTAQDGLDPDTARPGVRRKSLTRDQFLATEIAAVRGTLYTVREVILFEANIMGGVHAGASGEEKEEALEQLNRGLSVGGYTLSLRQLKAIGRIVVKALEPLRQAISGGDA